MRNVVGTAAAAVLLAGGLLWRGTAVSQPAKTGTTLLLTFGLKAMQAEHWDGSARVSGGVLSATEGRHFSAGDLITGPGAWKCVTRRDEVAPYADLHYTERRPGSRPEVLHQPVSVFLTVQPGNATRLAIETAQGNFDFALADIGVAPVEFLGGRATVVEVPAAEKITTDQQEDDEPAIAALPDGAIAVAWVAYRNRADRVLLRTRAGGSWSAPEEVTPRAGDIFRCSVVAAPGGLWVFWSERAQDKWNIWGRQKKNGSWQPAQRISGEGTNTFHGASSTDGRIYVVWQSFRRGQSDIYLRALERGNWSQEMRVSESPANDWEPEVAAGPGGAYVAWDSYDQGNYDVHFRAYEDGRWSDLRRVTSSPRFEAHASVAVDARGRPWVAWNESGVNWGKDQGFLIPTPLATPLHQERSVRVALWDGSRWIEPRQAPSAALPPAMRQNAEHPRIQFDGHGAMQMVFRHWTRRNSRSIGSPIVWENYLTSFDGTRWTAPRPLPSSGGWVEKHAALARDSQGEVWAAWMTDNRPFSTMIPRNSDVYCARLGSAPASSFSPSSFLLLSEPFREAIPPHNN
ncbi:MAG: hypothetical protein HY013_21165, partial [Candidatus Solibacter usitatus]|nr:hypothetical protein [Candidatus Solibacter usitatus]